MGYQNILGTLGPMPWLGDVDDHLETSFSTCLSCTCIFMPNSVTVQTIRV